MELMHKCRNQDCENLTMELFCSEKCSDVYFMNYKNPYARQENESNKS